MSAEAIAAHRAKIEAFLSTQTVDNIGLKEQELVVADENLTPIQGFEFLASKQVIASTCSLEHI
jgi:hypothetical protein